MHLYNQWSEDELSREYFRLNRIMKRERERFSDAVIEGGINVWDMAREHHEAVEQLHLKIREIVFEMRSRGYKTFPD